MLRLLKQVIGLGIITFTLGCGGTKCLIEDCKSLYVSDQIIEIKVSEQKPILDYKRGSMPGGFFPGLFSSESNIVSIEYEETKKGHIASINGKKSGETKVYFVNRAGAGAAKLDSTEREYWLDRLEGSKSYFTVIVN